jgi:methionyl-tRNA formyltransferase
MVDMPDSFYHSYIHELLEKTKARGHDVVFITDSKDIRRGDCLFLIGCRSILSKEQLQLNKYNLVLHPSKLPEGRGSAALIWKILEGDNEFYLTLFEANTKIDSGDIYYQEKIMLEGHELSDEIRYKQAMKAFDIVLKFIDSYPNVHGKKQEGKSTFYPKRTPKDSELNIDKTIREQFNLLRVVDNERYPAFFNYRGHKFVLRIYEEICCACGYSNLINKEVCAGCGKKLK